MTDLSNIPSPEHTKKLILESYALAYLRGFGSKEKAIAALENKCKMCAVDDCHCNYPEIIKVLTSL